MLALQSLKFAIHSRAFAFVRPELSFVCDSLAFLGDARPPIGDLISLVSERLASCELSLVVRERVLTLVEFGHGHRHRRQPPLLPPSLVEPSACGAGTARCCWAARRIEPAVLNASLARSATSMGKLAAQRISMMASALWVA